MRISVIIPTYNRADLVVQAVESVLAQSLAPQEIIVVDDGSTDDTLAKLAAFQNEIKVIRQKQRGVSAARNFGIQNAKEEWLAFLDSDDLWKSKKLERQGEELGKNSAAVCYTDEEWRKNGQWKNQKKIHKKYGGQIYQYCLPLCIISPSSVLLHKNVIDKIGLFDESLPACEDYDYWLRMSRCFTVLYIPERLIVKRAGEWEQLSNQHSLDRYRIIVLHNILTQPLSKDDYEKTVKELKYKCHIYAAGCEKHHRGEEAAWAREIAAHF